MLEIDHAYFMSSEQMTEAILQFKGKYAFLSNFYRTSFVYRGIRWPGAEWAYQAMKSDDITVWQYMAGIRFPAEAKKFGRTLEIRPDWNKVKNEEMYRVVYAKFYLTGLKRRLLDTGDVHLSEGNTWGDVYWGVDLRTGKGENHLGKILMRVRSDLTSKDT